MGALALHRTINGSYFENEVEVTKSVLTIEPLTLLTRIGGILGVGRTLVWLINICIEYILSFYSVINECV